MLKRRNSKGFTLIELICVLAILAAVISVSAPSLFGFFKGRSIQEESRRFLALTRYARSEAISSSVPFELWIDGTSGNYGLRRLVTYGEEEEFPIEYQLDENLEFELDDEYLNEEGLGTLVFQPDGSMDKENPEEIAIVENELEKLVFRKSDSGMEYVIDTEEEDE